MRRPNLLTDTRGATIVGWIAALVSNCIAFQSLGLNLADIFTTISNALG